MTAVVRAAATPAKTTEASSLALSCVGGKGVVGVGVWARVDACVGGWVGVGLSTDLFDQRVSHVDAAEAL